MSHPAIANPDPTAEKPRFRRRWIPLSLQFFVAMLVTFGAIWGWIGISGYRQHVAIREIERVGGLVAIRPRGPLWLRQRVGNEQMKPFDEVVAVNLYGSENPDGPLIPVEWPTALDGPVLDNTQVTDAALAYLKGLTGLQTLNIGGTLVTDAGVAHLKGLTNLQAIGLFGTRVTDAGLVHLKGM